MNKLRDQFVCTAAKKKDLILYREDKCQEYAGLAVGRTGSNFLTPTAGEEHNHSRFKTW